MSSKSKKETGSSGTQSHPFTRQFRRTLEEFPDLAITSPGEAASLQAASAVSGPLQSADSDSTLQTQVPGPTSSQVQAPFSSISAEGGVGSSASSFVTPEQRPASKKSAHSNRHSPASNRGGFQADQTVDQTVVPQVELSSSEEEEDSNGRGGRHSAASKTQAVSAAAANSATSAAQATARPASAAARDPQVYRVPPVDYKLHYEELRKFHTEEMQMALEEHARVMDALALKDTQLETWHSTLGAKDELIEKLRRENEEWRQSRQVRPPPDLQPATALSGSTYPALDQLTARVLTGGWPSLYDYQTGLPRGGYGAYQPGPYFSALPQVPPLISTGVVPSVLPLSSASVFSNPIPSVPQSSVSASSSIFCTACEFVAVGSDAFRSDAIRSGTDQLEPSRSGKSAFDFSRATIGRLERCWKRRTRKIRKQL